MSIWDCILLAAVGLAAGGAVIYIVRQKKRGKCVGCTEADCAFCKKKK